MKKFKFQLLAMSLASISIFQLSGCATTQIAGDISPTPTLEEVTSGSYENCPVWIYRNTTNFHRLNPETPFVFVNDLKVRGLKVSSTACLNLKPGKYQVSMKESFLFMPGYTSQAVIVEPKAGETIYIRYSKEATGLSFIGGTAVIDSKTGLSFVDRDSWTNRK